MDILNKPYTTKQYALFVSQHQGRKLCEDDTKIWFEDYPPHIPTAEELISEQQAFLASTDYIACKMAEFSDNKLILDELKTKYADILEQRRNARDRINELRGAE